MTPLPKEVYMLRAVKVSLYCNVVLFVIKLTAVILVNSLALLTDLGITFVGLIVSGILYYSVRMANRPSDFLHNYGYGKVEHVCEAIEGIILIGIALGMSFQAVLHLAHPRHIAMPWVGLLCSVINLTINFVGAAYIFRMARQSASPAIHAEGVHYHLEGIISSTIAGSFALSVLLSIFGWNRVEPFIDPLATLVVSAIVIVPSFKLAKKAFYHLLDASMEEGKTMQVIKPLGRHKEKYCEFRDIRSRSAGSKNFVDLKLILPEKMNLKEGHRIAGAIEYDIKANVPNSEVMITIHPCDGDCIYSKENNACPYL